MKPRILFAAAAILSVCSCTKTDNRPGLSDTKVLNIPAMEQSGFSDGDGIGLYLTYSAAENGSTLSDERYLDNILFIKTGDQFTSSPAVYYPEDTRVFNNIYAYFPYRENCVPAGTSVTEVSVAADQSVSDGSDDFRYAILRNYQPTEDITALEFRHAFAKVNIEIKPGGYYDNLEDIPSERTVTARNMIISGNFNFETEQTTPGTGTEDITPAGVLAASGSSLKGMYFIIPPQTVAAGNEFLVFDMGGDIFRLNAPEDLVFAAGTENTLTITLNADFSGTILNVNVDIDDWTEGGQTEFDEEEILPPSGKTVSDADGNIYDIIRIGKQFWMGSSLRTTSLNDGTPMTGCTDTDWISNLDKASYAAYNNDDSDAETYGLLYNRTAVESGRLCPEGWHVPSSTDWDELGKALGGTMDDYNSWLGIGPAMKSTDAEAWNGKATNSSGFNAWPSGYVYVYTDESGTQSTRYIYRDEAAYFWSMTAVSGATSFVRSLSTYYDDLLRYLANNDNGYAVRCVHDF